MLRRSYNKKGFLMFGLLSFSILAVVLTAYFVSRETFDDRGVAVSEIGMELRPSSGVITEEGLDIDLIINTHGEQIGGMELTLEYSSSLEYVSTSAGDIPGCTLIRDVEQGGNRVNLSCFIPPGSSTYRGSDDTFATVRFRRVDDGQARIEVKDVIFAVRDSRQEIEFDGGFGEYRHGDDLAMILRPSSGTIPGTGLSIDLIINTQNESVGGIEAVLDYSGPIEYVNLRQGEIDNCRVDDVYSRQSLSLHCFIDANEPAYSGQGDVFATVNFRAIGNGTAEIDITNVEFSLRDDRLEESFPGDKGEYRAVLRDDDEEDEDEDEEEPPPRSPFCGTLHDRTFPYDMSTWPSGSFCSTGDASPMNPAFPVAGGSTSWRCISGAQSISCSAMRESTPDDDDDAPGSPFCGTLHDRTFPYDMRTWPSGSFCSVGNSVPTSPSFPSMGASTSWECVSGTQSISCSASRELPPDDDDGQPPDERDTSPSPLCGDLHNTTFSYDTYAWPSGSFCSVGSSVPTSPSFPSMGASTSWECVSGTQSTSCSASRELPPDDDDGQPPDERDTSPSPLCGDLHNTTFSYDTYAWPSGSFCSVGNSEPTSPNFPSMGASTSWECVSGTQSTSCSASRHESPTKDKYEELPETSILDNKGFLLGFALLLVSAIIFLYNGNSGKKNFSMRGKLSL